MQVGVFLNITATLLLFWLAMIQGDRIAQQRQRLLTMEWQLREVERRTMAPPVCIFNNTQQTKACYYTLAEALQSLEQEGLHIYSEKETRHATHPE
jgi:hypothetical protein